jgi:hypothetical protein
LTNCQCVQIEQPRDEPGELSVASTMYTNQVDLLRSSRSPSLVLYDGLSLPTSFKCTETKGPAETSAGSYSEVALVRKCADVGVLVFAVWLYYSVSKNRRLDKFVK